MNDSIFAPQFTLTQPIEAALDSIPRSAWLVQNMLLMPKHQVWLQRQVAVKRAAATTRIEGATMSDDEVDELRKRGPGGRLTEDELANVNALAAYEFVDYLSDEQTMSLDEMAIRQLNREFLRRQPDDMPGRYRNGQNTVGQFTPPNQGDVPALMRQFSNWLQAEDEMNPILKAGIAHIQLVGIHPFWDGNGRVARGLATLIMQRSPYHFRKLLSLESLIFRMRDDYFSAIERTLGSQYSPNYDATPWLEFFARALMLHAVELQTELTDWHRGMEDIYGQLEGAKMTHRQADAIVLAIKTGKITRADYLEISGLSQQTASRDLAQLVKSGWLIPHGAGRGRYYMPDVPPISSSSHCAEDRLNKRKEL